VESVSVPCRLLQPQKDGFVRIADLVRMALLYHHQMEILTVRPPCQMIAPLVTEAPQAWSLLSAPRRRIRY
jgi:hypothetical protein